MAFGKGGCCAQMDRAIANAPRIQPRILQHTDPHHQIISFFNQMHALVIEIHIDDDIWIAGGIVGDWLVQEHLAK